MHATGSALEITDTLSGNDANVQIWQKPSSDYMNSQKFRIVRNSNGTFKFLSYSSNFTRAIVVKNNGLENLDPIIQYDDNGSTNGHWVLEPAINRPDWATKATRSEYAAMGMGYPIADTSVKHMPVTGNRYGPRSSGTHFGIDLSNASGDTRDQKLVAVADGKLVYKCTDPGESQGYCVSIELSGSQFKDPVSGNQLIVTYMHMRDMPTFRDNYHFSKNDTVGYIGLTGNVSSSTAYHLHFEVINTGGTWTNRNYNTTINPIYFFPNTSFTTGFSTTTYPLNWDTNDYYKQ